jgi:fluoroquinolone transport system permease protein
VRLFLTVQWRCGFPHIYLGMAILTVLLFRLALPSDYAEQLVPVFLLAEPGLLGLSLVAAQSYLERGERSAAALAVTPLRSAETVAALVATSASMAVLAGITVQGGVLGLDWRLAWLCAPLFLTATLSGLLGLGLSTRHADFTRFLVVGLIPATVVMQLPLLSYFELLPRLSFAWLPSDAALFAFANLARPDPDAPAYVLYTLLLIGYNALAFLWASRQFEERVIKRLEAT